MSKKHNILVVDDEAEFRAFLKEGLESEGFAVLEAGNSHQLMATIGSEKIDLVALDLLLGMEDGLAIARQIRAVRNIPIVMISGSNEPFDRVKGLESGADDFVTKPFLVRELVMRIDAVLRRYDLESRHTRPGQAAPLRVAFDHAILDLEAKAVTKRDGTPVELTDTEFRILEMLVRNPERVLSRDEIWQELKGREWTPLDRTIDGHIARLRRKIEPEGEVPTLIRSVRGVGYVFAGKTHVESLG